MPDSTEVLLQKWLAGEIGEAEAAHLLVSLESDPAAARRALGHLHVDFLLRELAKTGDLAAAEPDEVIPLARARRLWPAVLGSMAGAAALAVLGTVAFTGGRSGETVAPLPQAEETSKAVALLTRSTEATWDGPAPASLLEPGWLRLRSGLAQIEFFSGAQVVLEGPAEFRVISPTEGYCPAGRLSAEVPPQARGFKIGTPKGVIVDLGTAFGLNVAGGGAEVHVFRGEVELHERPDAPARGLREGQGAATGAGGTWTERAADPRAFAALHAAGERADEAQRQRFEAWNAAAPAWNADPSLLARFDFAEGAGRRLRNVAASHSVEDASVIGASWATGRWPAKPALEFRSLADRARLAIPGEPKELTLSAWVRVDGLGRRYNSLFMSEGWDAGAVHWQILDTGAIRLGIHSSPDGRGGDFDSTVVFSNTRFGQWTHVAVRIDASAGSVAHFVDGRKIADLNRGTGPFFLRPGLAELGNWNTSTHADPTPIRHLSGALDEFAAHARLLSDDELRARAELGRP